MNELEVCRAVSEIEYSKGRFSGMLTDDDITKTGWYNDSICIKLMSLYRIELVFDMVDCNQCSVCSIMGFRCRNRIVYQTVNEAIFTSVVNYDMGIL